VSSQLITYTITPSFLVDNLFSVNYKALNGATINMFEEAQANEYK
jgi:hypothetical protein